MILRVLDHYNDFHCIADKCKDSCCIGWEIDIDDDTYDYYMSVSGRFGKRLKDNICENEEGEHCFKLGENGRCPFLNQSGLCDIYSELGEAAFSEVCTEYPRFSVRYSNVIQKTMALSCEEVGRLVFTNPEPIKILDMEIPDSDDRYYGESFNTNPYEHDSECEDMESDDSECDGSECDGSECDDSECDDSVVCDDVFFNEEEYVENPKVIAVLEKAQADCIDILQNRSNSWTDRLQSALDFADTVQSKLNEASSEADEPDAYSYADSDSSYTHDYKKSAKDYWKIDRKASVSRFDVFEAMEILDDEWETEKEKLKKFYKNKEYKSLLTEYLESNDFRICDYEHLMVYFVFRYGMTAAVDNNYSSKIKMAIEFTLLLRDMAALRFFENGGHFSSADQIDVARIFSKEVEHSEDNVAYLEEEFLFVN